MVSLQIQFAPAFDRNFYGEGKVLTHDATLNMNGTCEVFMLLKSQPEKF